MIPGNFLSEGRHLVSASLAILNSHLQVHQPQVVCFEVVEGTQPGAARGDYNYEIAGAVRPLLEWTTEFSPEPRDLRGILTEARTA